MSLILKILSKSKTLKIIAIYKKRLVITKKSPEIFRVFPYERMPKKAIKLPKAISIIIKIVSDENKNFITKRPFLKN